MLGKLDQYILSQFFTVLVFFMLGLVGMFWLGQSVALIDEIVLRGENILTFFTLSARLLPNILLRVTPIAELAATLFTLNQLANHAEILVIQSAGWRSLRIALPFLLVGVLMAFVLYAFSLYLAPKSSRDLRLTVNQIEVNFTNNVVLSGRFIFPAAGVTMFADESLLTGEMLNIFIEDRRDEGVIRSYFAKRGVIVREAGIAKIALIDGQIHESTRANGEYGRAVFDRLELSIEDPNATANALKPWTVEQTTPALIAQIAKNPIGANGARGEMANRISYPLLAVILPMIAALIFLSAPFSRHGYGTTIFRAAAVGLGVAAFQLAIPNLVEKSFSLIWTMFVPSIVLVLILISARARTR